MGQRLPTKAKEMRGVFIAMIYADRELPQYAFGALGPYLMLEDEDNLNYRRHYKYH